jgi:hypothetical protein
MSDQFKIIKYFPKIIIVVLILFSDNAFSCPLSITFKTGSDICITDLDKSILDLPCKGCPKDNTFHDAIRRSGSKGISFAISDDTANPSWGISGSQHSTPERSDKNAIERCESLEYKNNPSKTNSTCKILLSNNAPTGKVTANVTKEDFLKILNTLSIARGSSISPENLAKLDHSLKDKVVISSTEVIKPSKTVDKSNIENRKSSLSIDASITSPDDSGIVYITVKTNTDTSSLKINGVEEGGKSDGIYKIKRIARAGDKTIFNILATDSLGNTESKTLTTQRINAASTSISKLSPEKLKRSSNKDAVAIIIGIENYKRVPKAEYANEDARLFYDYAVFALGVKPENIKLLIDSEANDVEIIKTFKNWLPINVNKDKTDIYVFYSGHGMPSSDGKSLYLLPQGVDKDLLERTAINQQEIISSLQASKPKSVTMFIDSCYSGLSRTGETLLASARPISLKSKDIGYPPEFTVISASSPDQISSSSPDLQHGIFSFYLMKGMEGDADINKDGKITAGEMQQYVSDKVQRQAMSMNRKQEPQLIGDTNKVLVGR